MLTNTDPGAPAQLQISTERILVGGAAQRPYGLQLAFKRWLDIAACLLLLALMLPALTVIVLAIRLEGPGPVFFRQQRTGKDGRLFWMYKFRTMVPDNDPTIHRDYYAALVRGQAEPLNGLFKLVDDPRITSVGRVLRRFSLDELPQMINIVRGEMSLVGPRPALPYEVELYSARERARLAVVPGLTGLWQVSGRNRLTFQEMVELDCRYIEGWSLWQDILILLRTPIVVLLGWGSA